MSKLALAREKGADKTGARARGDRGPPTWGLLNHPVPVSSVEAVGRGRTPVT